jgi:hypothetical protein
MLYALRVDGLNQDSDIGRHLNGHGYWGIRIRGDGTIEEMGSDFYKLHGFMMWGAWGIFGLV